MQTVLYIEKIGDAWTWLIDRGAGSVRDSRFMTPFSTQDSAERAARIWAEVHEVPIDRIDFCRPPITAELSVLTQELAETKTELAAARGLVKGLENNRNDLLGQLAVVAEELDGVSRKAARLSKELVISREWLPK